MMTLVIFDLDHTILRGDSDSAWFQFLIEKGTVDKNLVAKTNQKFYNDYVAGRLVFNDYADFAFGILRTTDIDTLKKLRDEYFESKVKPMICPNAVRIMQDHQRKGHKVIISTATNEFVTAPVAEYLMADDLIATKLEKNGDEFTGRHSGTPNFQSGKVVNILAWLKRNPGYDLDNTYFYSDSINDLPLLEKVGHPRPVNADADLKEVSSKKNWRVQQLNK